MATCWHFKNAVKVLFTRAKLLVNGRAVNVAAERLLLNAELHESGRTNFPAPDWRRQQVFGVGSLEAAQ